MPRPSELLRDSIKDVSGVDKKKMKDLGRIIDSLYAPGVVDTVFAGGGGGPFGKPGTLSVSTVNDPSGDHTHAITSSSAPGASRSLLATDVSGSLTLSRLNIGSASGAGVGEVRASQGFHARIDGGTGGLFVGIADNASWFHGGNGLMATSNPVLITGNLYTGAGQTLKTTNRAHIFVDEVTAILQASTGATAVAVMTGNAWWDDTNYRRLFARNAASTFRLESDGSFGFYTATDAGDTVDSIITLAKRASVSAFVDSLVDGSGGGFRAGALSDALWYRGAANLWRTPGSVTVDTGINAGTAAGAAIGEVRGTRNFNGALVWTITNTTAGTDSWAYIGMVGSASDLSAGVLSAGATPSGVLQPTDAFVYASGGVLDLATTAGTINFSTDGNSNQAVLSGSQFRLPTTGVSAGLLLGGDFLLYRSAVDMGRTPDGLTVDLGLNIGSASGAATGEARASVGFAARVDGSGGGLYAGAASDVLWYRESTDIWRTPDAAIMDGRVGLATTTLDVIALVTIGLTGTNPLTTVTQWGLECNFVANATATEFTIANFEGGAAGGATVSTASTIKVVSPAKDGTAITRSQGIELILTTAYSINYAGVHLAEGVPAYTGNWGIYDESAYNWSMGGQLQLRGQGSSYGLLLGGDFLLYRSAADMGRTPDGLTVDLGLNIGSASGAATGEARASVGFAARVDGSGGGFYAGAASDVQLYRSAADVWRTPDSVIVDSNLMVGATSISTSKVLIMETFSTDTARQTLRIEPIFDTAGSTGGRNAVYAVPTITHASGTLAIVRSFLAGLVGNGNGGTVTDAIGYRSEAAANTGHTFTTLYHYQVTNATGAGSVGTQYGLYIPTLTKGATDIGLYIQGADTYAIHVDAGLSRFDGNGTRVFELPADATDPTAGGGAAIGRIPVLIGGVTRYLAYY